MPRFAGSSPRGGKSLRGRTGVRDTPLAVRARVTDLEAEGRARATLGRALGSMAPRIERLTVRFDDVNGPRNGLDTVCRIKAVVSGEPSVVVEQMGHNPDHALARATPRMKRALRELFDRRKAKMPAPSRKERTSAPRSVPRAHAAHLGQGSLIGRRVGRARQNLDAALERPEKSRRDAYVDTAAPGTSASDRRAGGGATARRNSKRPNRKQTVTLEDSRGKPSRKSTRRSANRTKGATKKTLRARSRTRSPRARHARGK